MITENERELCHQIIPIKINCTLLCYVYYQNLIVVYESSKKLLTIKSVKTKINIYYNNKTYTTVFVYRVSAALIASLSNTPESMLTLYHKQHLSSDSYYRDIQ